MRVLVDFLEPVIQVDKSAFVEQIKDQDYAIRPFVVGVGDCAVPLLASGIPDLQLYLLSVVAQGSESKINANCGHVILIELIVSESNKEARFADARIAQKNHFEEVIVIFFT